MIFLFTFNFAFIFTTFVDALRSIFGFKKDRIADGIGISSSLIDKHRSKPDMAITNDTSGLLARFVIAKLDEKSLEELTSVRRQLLLRTVEEGLMIFEPTIDRPEVASALNSARRIIGEN